MNPFVQAAIGGALGATCRLALTRAMPAAWQATILANLLGCLAMGVVAAGVAHRWGPDWAPLLMAGLLGGFTTFSAFSLEAVSLWERGQGAGALAYVGASVLLSLAAVAAGLALGREIWA